MAVRSLGRPRRAISPGWLHFAESVVERAGVLDDDIAQALIYAFASVPRDSFVAEGLGAQALQDAPVPIGYGQIVTQPSTIARMLSLIGIRPGLKVLEVGCGSGYTSAVMAAAGASVFTIEIVGLLAQQTRRRLDALNFQNVLVRRGDGRRGWAEHAPYDAIVVSTVFETIEPELLAQLVVPGGRLIAPVGGPEGQVLTLWEARRGGAGMYQLEPCNFAEGLTQSAGRAHS